MQRAQTSRRLIVALVAFLFPGVAWAQYLPTPGPGPIFPASDSPRLSALAPETFEPPPPRGYAQDIRQLKQEAAWVSGLPPGHIQYDVGASPATGGVRPLGRFGVQQESEPQPAAPSLGTNFNGISYTGWIPPDP